MNNAKINMGYWLTQLIRFCETAVMSMGAHLTIAVSNIFFLGIPVVYTLGAYVMVIAQKQGVSLCLSIIIALVGTLIVSLIFVFSYLKLSKDSFTVFTLASILAFDAILKSWDSVTGGVLGISGIVRPGFIRTLDKMAIFQIVLTIVVLLIEYIILKTWLGRALLGMKENKYIVETLGISTRHLGAAAIIISSVVAAVAGMTSIWRVQFLDPGFGGIIILIQVVTVAIIAAKPKVRWLALATLFVILLPELLRFFVISSVIIGHLRNLLYAVLLIIILKTISHNLLPRKRFI